MSRRSKKQPFIARLNRRKRRSSLTNAKDSRHKKDATWKKRTRNPYAKKEKTSPWKWKAKIFIIIVCGIAMLGISMYHPFFYVQKKDIFIKGLSQINTHDIEEKIQGIINYNKWFILPGDNYFFVDVSDIRDILLESNFPIDSVVVQKNFPNTITIDIEEKISTIIYDNGKQYSYLGLQGHLVEIIQNIGEDEWEYNTKIVTSTNELGEIIEEEIKEEGVHTPKAQRIQKITGDYPVIYDVRNKEVGENYSTLKPIIIKGIIEWYKIITKKTDIPLTYIEITNELGDATLFTKEGWEIKVKVTKNIQTQFQSLLFILEEKVQRPNINYIDLRYGDQIYVQ
ncbi:MAG: FtsQ-type POTRA domain-containing protein [Candidatus Magasanikbacteria bacterium]|jgi:cell division septal protein FtsQ|nr:FtsQ-type POTRA domain-containing protein [Candidatus Magasanikbacteria bacterium]MBT4221329.1 FtsQ-type POTRA domain-containing protein [Candidatus Magasanikbacteria bacterium]MBT4350823.1 FtsQ-type POTRA domain-containing protein [Candidatus Magasanikbacteria bacterium]MBT4542177.1 FtsQ-type POTRA domain-containing protein [Candidatus Magasanikbacteria bacterium]MBT6253453.1 FtsQ-type POTRA domain-containing protein [Candidatus Magasanikbacteria bacterium]